MRYFLFVAVLFMAMPVMAQNGIREMNDRSYFIQFDYAPNSNHLSNDDAPVGGYNEDNDIVIIRLGREFDWKPNWKYALSIGYTDFENSYNESSRGLGVGAEAIYLVAYDVSVFAGGDFGFVSGYEDNVNNDFVIFDEYIPFFALNAGVEYEINDKLPTIRIGGKYVPASIVDSDDVVALTFGTRFKF